MVLFQSFRRNEPNSANGFQDFKQKSGERIVDKMSNAANVLTSPWLFVDLVVLYIAGCLIGVPLEGLYVKIGQGHWETHVVSMIGPFCVIYGFGAVLYYLASLLLTGKPIVVRFLLLAATGTFFELLCGLLLLYGLKMRAWDYSNTFMNYKGLICLSMFFAWGAIGLGFDLLVPRCSALLARLHRQPFGILAVLAAVVLLADLIFTGICISRWKKRYLDDLPATTALEQMIDERYPDDYMQNRFIEWRFIRDSEILQPEEA